MADDTDETTFFDLDSPRFAMKPALARLFERLGCDVQLTGEDAEEGRDLVIRREDFSALVACRNETSPADETLVQYLHSALVSDRETTHGITVNPGGFSEEARAAAARINEEGEFHIELWGIDTLQSRGEEAGLFFHSWSLDAPLFFCVPWNEESQLPDVFASHYVEPLHSHPRATTEALTIRNVERSYLPAIEVGYAVDKRFTADSETLYHAREEGLEVFSPSGHTLDDEVYELVERAGLQRLPTARLQGEPVASFFRGDLERYRSQVADRVSRRLTKTIEYSGENRTYTRHCEVQATDIDVNARPLVVARNTVGFELGPREYSIEALDFRGGDWQFLDESSGFEDGDDGLRNRNGYLCNDCARITPADEGASCAQCERTLCPEHRWEWPARFPRGWPELCASCYREREPQTHRLGAGLLEGWPFGLVPLGILPGLSFMLGRRYLPSALLILLTLLLELGILLWAPLAGLPRDLSQLLLLLPVGLSLWATIYWWRRIAVYRATLRKLKDVQPPWS